MRVDSASVDGTHLLYARGDIDLDSLGPLERALDAAPLDRPVAVDLADVGFVDSAGLGLLIRHGQRLADAGGSLHVRNPSPGVRRVFNITGLDHLLG